MDSAQVIAAFIAGIIAPFIQEAIFGAKITGRAAAVLAAVVAFIIATLAFWATGGFAVAASSPAFSLVDPSAFFGFWIRVFTPVYAIQQLVYGITTKHGEESPPATGPIQSVAATVQPIIKTG